MLVAVGLSMFRFSLSSLGVPLCDVSRIKRHLFTSPRRPSVVGFLERKDFRSSIFSLSGHSS